MATTVLCIMLLAGLAIVCLPVARIHLAFLRLIRIVLTLIVLAVLGGAGTALFKPGLVPEPVRAWSDRAVEFVGIEPARDQPGFGLVGLAAAFTVAATAVFAFLDFAIRLTAHTALVDRLLGDIRSAALAVRRAAERAKRSGQTVDPVLAGRASAIDTAVDAMTRPARARSSVKRRRVADFLDDAK